jgi:hypothetical protein
LLNQRSQRGPLTGDNLARLAQQGFRNIKGSLHLAILMARTIWVAITNGGEEQACAYLNASVLRVTPIFGSAGC